MKATPRTVLLASAALLLGACSSRSPAPSTRPQQSSVDYDKHDLPTYSEVLGDAVTLLRTLNILDGAGVGPRFKPGTFYQLVQVFIVKGTAADFRGLCEEKNPVARAMGVLCLRLTGSPDLLQAAAGIVGSRVRMDVLPFGCNVDTWREADVARLLIDDPGFFGHSDVGLEIPGQAMRRLALSMLVDDRMNSAFLVRWGADLDKLTDSRDAPDVISDLRRLKPELEEHLLVKAVGRLNATERRTRFLVNCMSDTQLRPKSRLAAASGLAAYGDKEAREVLVAAREKLDALSPGHWGSSLIAGLDARMARRAVFRKLGKRASRQARTDAWLEAMELPSISHPTNLAALCYWVEDAIEDELSEDDLGGVEHLLLKTAGQLSDVSAPWHVQSDMHYAMFDLLCEPTVREKFRPHVWSKLAASIEPRLPDSLRSRLNADVNEASDSSDRTSADTDSNATKSVEEVLDGAFGATIEDQIRNLADDNVMVRRYGASRLVNAGPPARAALDALKKALSDPDHDVSVKAGLAIAPFGDEAAVVVEGAHAVVMSAPKIMAKDKEARAPVTYIGMLAAVGRASAGARDDLVRLLACRGASSYLDEVSDVLRRTGPATEAEARSLVRTLGSLDINVLQINRGMLGADVNARAATVIVFMDTVPALADALAHPDPEMRRGAARVLSILGTYGRPAARNLTPLLESEDRETRIAATIAWGEMAIASPRAARSLSASLASDDKELALMAALAARRSPSGTEELVRGLIRAAREGVHEEVQYEAADALGALGPKASSAVGDLSAIMREYENGPDDPLLAWRVGRALCHIGPSEGDRSRVLRNLMSRDGTLAPGAINAAGALGPDARVHLEELARSDDRGTSENAKRELLAQDLRADQLLASAITETEAPVLPDSSESFLSYHGFPHMRNAHALMTAIGHRRPDIRLAAARALCMLPDPPVKAVMQVFDYDDRAMALEYPQFERNTMNARIRITGWRNAYHLEFVWMLLALYGENATKAYWMRLMVESGCPPEDSVPLFEQLLMYSHPEIRAAAAANLGRLGPAARSAAPSLRLAARDEDGIVRSIARDALQKIVGEN